jgi:hypothetical protein
MTTGPLTGCRHWRQPTVTGMRKSWKSAIYPLVVPSFAAVCVYAGILGDVSVRDWRSLLSLVGMLVGFFALLWLGPRDHAEVCPTCSVDCGMGATREPCPSTDPPS